MHILVRIPHIFLHIVSYSAFDIAYQSTFCIYMQNMIRFVHLARVSRCFNEISKSSTRNQGCTRAEARMHMHQATGHGHLRTTEVVPAAGTMAAAGPSFPGPLSASQAFHPTRRSVGACSRECSAMTSSRLEVQSSSDSSSFAKTS